MHNRGVKSLVIKTSAICRNNAAAECRLHRSIASASVGDEQALRVVSIKPIFCREIGPLSWKGEQYFRHVMRENEASSCVGPIINLFFLSHCLAGPRVVRMHISLSTSSPSSTRSKWTTMTTTTTTKTFASALAAFTILLLQTHLGTLRG